MLFAAVGVVTEKPPSSGATLTSDVINWLVRTKDMKG